MAVKHKGRIINQDLSLFKDLKEEEDKKAEATRKPLTLETCPRMSKEEIQAYYNRIHSGEIKCLKNVSYENTSFDSKREEENETKAFFKGRYDHGKSKHKHNFIGM